MINKISINPDDYYIKLVYKKGKNVKQLAEENGADLAISFSYVDYMKTGFLYGNTVADGKLIFSDFPKVAPRFGFGIKDNKPYIGQLKEGSSSFSKAGPLLVLDGKDVREEQIKIEQIPSDIADSSRVRIGVGLTKQGHIQVLYSTHNITLEELTEKALEEELDVFENGDGGGSVTVYKKGEGVINRTGYLRPVSHAWIFIKKEDDRMKINGIEVIEDFIPKSNTTSRPAYPMVPEYITIHNTGNSKMGANAEMHTEYIDTAKGYVSWHYTVGDKAIYQELPTNENAWAAGDGANGAGNRKSIHIEVTENQDGDYKKAEENAIELIRHLMKKHDIPIENVVPHQYWSGKYCPRKILPRWDDFIEVINIKKPKILANAKVILEENSVPAYITDQGRTVVEVRTLGELLGLQIGWDGKTRTVTLKK